MPAPKESPETLAMRKYLQGRRILIADPSASSRSGLYRIFQELGAQSNLIVLVNTFKQAEEQITETKPQIVVAEFDLGKRCGLDLLQSQRQQRPEETKEILFLIATCNTSQSAVARAAEEDIDAYVLKPFTPEAVRNTIMRAALIKIKPPQYLVLIDQGKKELAESKFDEAEKTFLEAAKLDATPSLAHYYYGQTKYVRKILDQAKGSYTKGLEYNKIHYKCLVGLYELLMSQNQHSDAYEVVKKISHYFPANPKRLGEVLRLAIMTGKYEDVERYYSIFCSIDERNEDLIRYVCAALVVCGKYYLNTRLRSRALELFQKAAATGTGRVKTLKEIVQALLDAGLNKEAKAYLVKFPPETQTGDDYLIMRFQVLNSEGNRSLIIDQGRILLTKGIVDVRLYTIMIQRSLESKLTAAAETLIHEAIKKFPNKKDHFEAFVKVMKAA